jgi:hypothetical protein
MAKCINHPRRKSASVDEPGIPPLCRECWEKEGLPVKPGDNVICTVAHPSSSGVVTRLVDGSIAVTQTLDGGESWNPVALLVRWK